MYIIEYQGMARLRSPAPDAARPDQPTGQHRRFPLTYIWTITATIEASRVDDETQTGDTRRNSGRGIHEADRGRLAPGCWGNSKAWAKKSFVTYNGHDTHPV
jgi:hypothetical protein